MSDLSTIAGILASGYNRFIEIHGPDDSFAAQPDDDGPPGSEGFMLSRDGQSFRVTVEVLVREPPEVT